MHRPLCPSSSLNGKLTEGCSKAEQATNLPGGHIRANSRKTWLFPSVAPELKIISAGWHPNIPANLSREASSRTLAAAPAG